MANRIREEALYILELCCKFYLETAHQIGKGDFETEKTVQTSIQTVRKALDELFAYENADLIERNTVYDEIQNKDCSQCKAEECYGECRTTQLLDFIAGIPRFEPKTLMQHF